MDKPELSIIVPVYNTEKYLEQCIYSILLQEFESCEIILIDDGSSDKSGEICNKFAEERNKIHVIHQENQGVSSARNRGLREAKGKYITFVDSDDFISPEIYVQLIETLEINNADLACCDVDYYTEDGHKTKGSKKRLPAIMSEKDFMAHLFDRPRTVTATVHNKLYCRDRILQFFDESISICEDMKFLFNYCVNCKKIAFINEPYYHIRERNDSLSRNKNQNPEQGLNTRKEIISLVESLDSNLRNLAESDFLDSCLLYGGRNNIQLKNYIKTNFFKLLMNPAITFKLKAVCLLTIIYPRRSFF